MQPMTVGLGPGADGDLPGNLGSFGDAHAMYADGSIGGARSSKTSRKKDEDDSNYTTIMLRNIPNKYTRQMLIDQLHRAGFRGDIDYLYLPVDFANRCNVGYCFINMRTAAARERFNATLNGVAAQSCLPGFNSYKVCQVTKAKWQGRDENIRRLRSGPELMEQLAAHPEWLPLLLDEQGNQQPFPMEDTRGGGLRGGMGALGATRRPPRKRNTAGGPATVPGFPFAGLPADFAALSAAYSGAADLDDGAGRGRGGDRGGRRANRRGTGKGSQPLYPDPAFTHAAYAAAGCGGVPMVPVMTEHGFQYVPYDGTFDAGFYPAMPGAQMLGVPYAAAFAGFPAWNPLAFTAAKGAAMYTGAEDYEDDEDSEEEDEGEEA